MTAALQMLARICILPDAVLHHARRRSVYCLKHRISSAYVGASCCSHSALKLSRFIGDYVTIQIRQDEYVEIAVDLIVHQICRHDIDIPVISLYLRIILCHIIAQAEELAVSLLHDICLCYDGDVLVAVVSGIFKGSSGQSLSTHRGRDLEIDGDIIIDIYSAAAERILSLGVFSVKNPVDVLLRYNYRSDVRENGRASLL